MTAIDFKTFGDLIGKFGPTDAHRQEFGRSFLGTLLGQTIVLVGMMLAYVVVVVLLRQYAYDQLHDLHADVGSISFWSIMAAPLICILLFSMLPTSLRAVRERRMKAAVIGGDVMFKPGYFRLYPYGEADRATFKRLDGAVGTILGWLHTTNDSVLYLSGASGVGKSSLLAASVLPTLRAEGWAVIETRLFGDPVERLRTALFTAGLFARKPTVDTTLRHLLERAVAARVKSDEAPLLLVIDQFEEFLILHRDEDRTPLAALLADLVKRPIKGVRLLLVFRSDYRPLVFKLDLPPLDARRNWYELGPYGRGEATTFLQSGGRELSPSALAALFSGLDRIEDAPGIYRPITLNMVGLVLERMGRALEGDPGRLIQSYLTTCLTQGEARDFARPLLARMITDAGTKEPRSESDLVVLTGLEPWQVKASLANLAQQGLVRRLEGATAIWEVAHDFLARIIGQLIGRLRPSILHRVRLLIAPVVLLSWATSCVVAVPYWLMVQERAAQEALKLIASLSFSKRGGMSVAFSLDTDDKVLRTASLHLERVRPTEIRLPFASPITSLEPIKGLTNLTRLDLNRTSGITSLEPIRGLTNLTSLDLSGASGVTSLEPIKGLTKLTSLNLFRARGITSLEPIEGLTNLTNLGLRHATGITSLEPIRGLTKLTSLDLGGARGITSLEPIKGLTDLTSLNLHEAIGITSLEPLKGRKKIEIEGGSKELLATMK